MILHVFIAMLTGWINNHRQEDMAYLQVDNRFLTVQLGGCRRPLTDTKRRRLTPWPHPLHCTPRKDIASIARSDSLMPCLTCHSRKPKATTILDFSLV